MVYHLQSCDIPIVLNSLQTYGMHTLNILPEYSSPYHIYRFLNSLQKKGKLWTRSDLNILPECSNLIIDIHIHYFSCLNFYISRFSLLSLKMHWKPRIITTNPQPTQLLSDYSRLKINLSSIFFFKVGQYNCTSNDPAH